MNKHEMNRAEEPCGSSLSRRDVLQKAGLAAIAAALPPVSAMAAPQREELSDPSQTMADFPVSEVMTQLATYISQAGDHAIPDDVAEQTKWHILDTFAAMVSGSQLPAGRAAARFAQLYGGKPQCTLVAENILCGPIDAAMLNAVTAHADETDDAVTGPWHPGCNVVPAALATGELFKNDGTRMIRSVALGYDIGTRMLITIQPGLRNSHRLTYGIGGIFGATAAASCAASLNVEQTRWAISYAAQQCSGIETFPRDIDHIEKGFTFAGMNARSGVTAVLLVHTGWNGVNDVLSGPDNFLMAYAPTAKPELLVDKLGERYEMMSASIKRWTVGFPIEVVLDAIEELQKKHPIDPHQVQQITLRYMPGSITDNSGPSDINVQYAVAVMLLDKTVTFKSSHDKARMHDPEIVRLKSKIRLEPGPPGARGDARPPLVQITMMNGEKLVQDSVGKGVLGTTQNPMNRDQLVAKCRDLMSPVLGSAQTTKLIDRVMNLEQVKNLHDLRPVLQNAHPSSTPKLSNYPGAS